MPLRMHATALLRPLARLLLSAMGRRRPADADGYEAWLSETFAR